MADKTVYVCAETGSLSGTTITLSGTLISGMLAAQLFSDALSDGDTVTITVADASDSSVFAVYSDVPFTASGTTLDLSSGTLLDSAGTLGSSVNVIGLAPANHEVIQIAVTNDVSPLTTGAAQVTFRMPFAMTLVEVRASVKTAPTGSTIVVDINEDGSTIMTTNKLSIDAGEYTSTTAATAAGITDSALADDAEITVDIDQIGSTVAGTGLIVTLIGRRV